MVVTTARRSKSAVGRLLRDWRTARGLSQLELSERSGFSARHISFSETGRTTPSRQALLTLAESLDLPLRDRNRLLLAAGYASAYRETPLSAAAMAHVRTVLGFLLERHEPYAAVVLDRYSNTVLGNAASRCLIGALVDPSLLVEPVNYLRIAFHPLGARRWIENWDEVSRHLLARATRELGALTGDASAAALLAELRAYAGPTRAASGESAPAEAAHAEAARADAAHADAAHPEIAELLLPLHVRLGQQRFSLFSTIMTLGTPMDLTLQELRLETFFPADPESERAWQALRAGEGAAAGGV